MCLIQESQLNVHADDRGTLVAIEGEREVPFEIKRVYYIVGAHSEARRGYHAHYRLRQMAICVSGSCRFIMNDGTTRVEHVLGQHSKGLLIEPMVWHEMDSFSPDCVLLVLADAHYDREDYIHVYDQFVELVRARSRLSLALVA